jgi:hypothetical protein
VDGRNIGIIMTKRIQRKIKYVDLVFENCEVARLTPPMFHGLWMENITTGYECKCGKGSRNEVGCNMSCGAFWITVNKDGLDKAKMSPAFLGSKTLRERLKSKDITRVDLIFTNGKNEYILVPWEVDERFDNGYQEHETEWGEIRITIKKP